MRFNLVAVLIGLVMSGCSVSAPSSQDQFFGHLSALCGQSFQGQVISTDAVDDDWRKEILTIQVKNCSDTAVHIPLHVGENRSRTWVVSKTQTGLRLKHDHRHADGSPDAVNLYGGDTAAPGTALRQVFPVDDFSIALFEAEGLSASVTNVWSFNIMPGSRLTYELSRPGRLFQAEFDLTKPVAAPPPAWGHEG